MPRPPAIHQINLSRGLGGGEVYTLFFTRALVELGCEVTLHVHREAEFWHRAELPGVRLVPVASGRELLDGLPPSDALIVTQTALFPDCEEALANRHRLTGFAHMPLWGRNPRVFDRYHRVFAVSGHVLQSLAAAGCRQVHPEPMYGIAEFRRIVDPNGDSRIIARPIYVVDRRKFRDRLIGLVQPVVHRLRPPREYVPRPGVTLGIVSLLSPIKQFPELFRIVAPILAEVPDLHLEVFGFGGYAYVRDMRRTLAPLGTRVRFWGAQTRPEAIYPRLHWLLSGLPEKEALGLNLLESQACGTPVLAVRAPPFTETVADGASGHLYDDPRRDGGRDFRRVLATAVAQAREGRRPDPRQATEHLARFAYPAFRDRVDRLLTSLSDAG